MSFDALMDEWLAAAGSQGASPRQIELLREARQAGEVSLATVREAIDDTLNCFEQQEVEYYSLPDDSGRGFVVPQYSYGLVDGLSEDESLAIADDCITRHSFAIEFAYQTQPSSIEAEDAIYQALIPELEACLLEQGAVLSEDPTWQELVDVNMEIVFGDSGGKEHASVGYDCLGAIAP